MWTVQSCKLNMKGNGQWSHKSINLIHQSLFCHPTMELSDEFIWQARIIAFCYWRRVLIVWVELHGWNKSDRGHYQSRNMNLLTDIFWINFFVLRYMICSAVKIILYYNGRFPNNFLTHTMISNMCDSFIPALLVRLLALSLELFAKSSFTYTQRWTAICEISAPIVQLLCSGTSHFLRQAVLDCNLYV